MKTNHSLSKSIFRLAPLVLAFIMFACSKDDPAGTDPTEPQFSDNEASEFDITVAALALFNQPSEASIVETEVSDPQREGNTEFECFTKTYNGAPGYNELFMLDPTTDVIYPGAMLKGESIPTGEYISINADRAPITLSTSFSNINGRPSVTIENPNLISEVRGGIQELLNREVNGATPARLIVDQAEVYSEEHMAIAIGANYKGLTKSISGSIDFNRSVKKNTYVLKFIQKYFTLDLDTPGKSPSDLFTDLPSIESLGSTSPVYVSTVTYGRMVLYTVESDSTITQVRTAFDAAISAGFDGSIDGSGSYETLFQSSTVKATVIGGSGASATQVINGPQGVYNVISEGGNYSKDSPGAPLAYKLRYVREGFPVAKVVLATEYQVRSCDLAYPQFKVTINNLNVAQFPTVGGEGPHLEIWGSVNAELKKNDQRVGSRVRWVRPSNNELQILYNVPHTISDSETIEVERPDYDNDYIELYGDLNDKDLLSSENLGVRSLQIPLNSLDVGDSMSSQLIFDEVSFHRVVATFTVERIK